MAARTSYFFVRLYTYLCSAFVQAFAQLEKQEVFTFCLFCKEHQRLCSS